MNFWWVKKIKVDFIGAFLYFLTQQMPACNVASLGKLFVLQIFMITWEL